MYDADVNLRRCREQRRKVCEDLAHGGSEDSLMPLRMLCYNGDESEDDENIQRGTLWCSGSEERFEATAQRSSWYTRDKY